jgi:hypothetical protein
MYTYLAVFSAAIVSAYLPSPKRMDNITKELKRYTYNRVGVGFGRERERDAYQTNADERCKLLRLSRATLDTHKTLLLVMWPVQMLRNFTGIQPSLLDEEFGRKKRGLFSFFSWPK